MPCGAWRETVFRHLQELHNMSLSTAHLLDQCSIDSLSRYHRNSQLSQSLPWLFRADVAPLNVNYRSAFPNASSPSLMSANFAGLFICVFGHPRKEGEISKSFPKDSDYLWLSQFKRGTQRVYVLSVKGKAKVTKTTGYRLD